MKSNELESGPRGVEFRLRRDAFRVVYAVLLLLIMVFLYRLGLEPWSLAAENWHLVVLVVVTTGAGLVVQAQSFRTIQPLSDVSVELRRLINIWSLAAISSVVAPLFAGIATRTVLLVKAGMSVGTCLVASARQFWMGVEFSLLLGAVSLPLTDLPYAIPLGCGLAAGWAGFFLVRLFSGAVETKKLPRQSWARQLLASMRERVPLVSYFWFALQPLLMSATFYLAFNGMNAELSIMESMALASVTVLLSVVILVPNGLGFNDAIWVFVATRAGLTLSESVAIAILMRLSHLLSSVLIYVATRNQSQEHD